MSRRPPCLNSCFIRIGSNAGSKSSWTSSRRSGFPFRTHASRVCRYLPSESLISRRPFCSSEFLIHLFACICGSIMSGHRRPFVTMMPFSVERGSAGSPWMFQPRMVGASPMMRSSENAASTGIPFAWHSATQILIRSERKFDVNAPVYATTPEAMRMLPVRSILSWFSWISSASHRTCSDARPLVSCSARPSRAVERSLCSWRSSRSLMVLRSFSSSSFTLASTWLSWAVFSARSADISETVRSASASLAFFGSTFFATRA
mmetsp:Transcript_22669/g.53886  ORF Transcript_22669/g.53886 Transcript_22669/m.53886 type:complete len:262 (+) Transcript_22669:3023-3808(+)